MHKIKKIILKSLNTECTIWRGHKYQWNDSSQNAHTNYIQYVQLL